MGVPFQLILGTLLVLVTCSSTHQTKLRQIRDATSTPAVPFQTVTEISSRDLNKIINPNTKTDTLDTKSKSAKNVLYEQFPIKLGRSEPYSKPENDSSSEQTKSEENVSISSSTENHREDSSRSIDIDSTKFVSPDFHSKNNLFTFSHQENHEEHFDTAFKGTRHPSFDTNIDLTTPSTKLFDQKFKETVDSVDQKLDEVDIDDPDDDDRIEDIDDDDLNVENLLKKRPKNSTIEYESRKSIVNNETVDKNSIHRDLRIEHVKKINFEQFHNDTGIYGITKDDSDVDEAHGETTATTYRTFTEKNKSLSRLNPANHTFSDITDHSDTEPKPSSEDQVTVQEPSAAKTGEDLNIIETTTALPSKSVSYTTFSDNIEVTPASTTLSIVPNISDQDNIIPLHLGTEKYHHLTEITKPTKSANREVEKVIERVVENSSTTLDPIPLRTTLSGEQSTIFSFQESLSKNSTETANPKKSSDTEVKKIIERIAENVSATTEMAAVSTVVDPIIDQTTFSGQQTTTSSYKENLTETTQPTKSSSTEVNKIVERVVDNDSATTGIPDISTVEPNIFVEPTTIFSFQENFTEQSVTTTNTPEEILTHSTNVNLEDGVVSLKGSEETTTQLSEKSSYIQFETSSMIPESTTINALDSTTLLGGEAANYMETEKIETTTEAFPTTTGQQLLDADSSTLLTEIGENGTESPSETTQPILDIMKIDDIYNADGKKIKHNLGIETTESSDQNDTSTTTELSFVHIGRTDKGKTTSSTEFLNPKFINSVTLSVNNDNKQRKVIITTTNKPVDDLTTSSFNYSNTNNDETTNISTTIEEGTEATSIGDHYYKEGGGGNQGKIAAIAISCVAAICLVILAGLLYVMKRRQKRLNYGSKCTPVSLDDYSIDNLSVYNSVRRKGAARMSKRSFGNPAFEDPVAPTHPLNFAALVKFSTNFEDIKAEFEEIPQITARTSELPEGCDTKNRYANVIPLPETRVFLKHIDGYPNSDYINASYVTGPRNIKGYYIATQGPLHNTVDDFWRMIWEQQSKVILMLTHLVENGLEKCVDYLPESEVIECSRLFGDFQITLKKREVKEKYIISSLQLKNMVSNSWREVTHFWFLGWPEKGVPSEANSLIAFLIEARSFMKSFTIDKNEEMNGIRNGGSHNDHNPVVIHCSPGTGRTGVAIACDIAIRQFETTRLVDIPKIVYRIRRDRANAIQTKEQYMFIYKVVTLYATKLTGGALDNL